MFLDKQVFVFVGVVKTVLSCVTNLQLSVTSGEFNLFIKKFTVILCLSLKKIR